MDSMDEMDEMDEMGVTAGRGRDTKRGRLGRVSVLAGLIAAILYVCVGAAMARFEVREAGAMALLLLGAVSNLVGLAAGTAGVMLRGQKRTAAVAGLVLNGLLFLPIVWWVVVVLALLSGAGR